VRYTHSPLHHSLSSSSPFFAENGRLLFPLINQLRMFGMFVLPENFWVFHARVENVLADEVIKNSSKKGYLKV
jgi:hypothetical protein